MKMQVEGWSDEGSRKERYGLRIVAAGGKLLI